MADVVSAFLQGHQYAQAESAHEQQLEENKLRTMVLKHQIAGMAIDDQLRARELQRQNLEMLQGQPSADLPQEGVDQPNLPSRSLAGIVNGLIQQRQGTMTTPAQNTAADTSAAPSFTPAPDAQATAPGTNTVSRSAAVNIPGVDALGVGGVNIRPRSLEDLVRARIQEELTKPYNLGPGEKRMIGGDVLATGGDKLQPVGVGGLANQSGQIVVPGAGRVVRPVAGTNNGRTAFGTPQADGSFTVAGQPAPNFKPRPTAYEEGAPDREQQRTNLEGQRALNNDRLLWSAAVSQGQRQHAGVLKIWTEQHTFHPDLEPPPPYVPPSFAEWRRAHGSGGSAVTQPSDPLQAADPATGTVYKFPTAEAAAGYKREKGHPVKSKARSSGLHDETALKYGGIAVDLVAVEEVEAEPSVEIELLHYDEGTMRVVFDNGVECRFDNVPFACFQGLITDDERRRDAARRREDHHG